MPPTRLLGAAATAALVLLAVLLRSGTQQPLSTNPFPSCPTSSISAVLTVGSNLSRSTARLRQKLVVFQCRAQDNCGGWGDRLSGLFGAAALAISLRRKLVIDWQALEQALEPSGLVLPLWYDEHAVLSPAEARWVAEQRGGAADEEAYMTRAGKAAGRGGKHGLPTSLGAMFTDKRMATR